MSSDRHAHDRRPRDSCLTESSPFGDATASLLRMQGIVGRKWQPLLIYHLRGNGSMGFSDLKSAVEGISSKMLSESLDDLETAGVVEREVVSDQPVRVAYSLTDAGEALERIVCDLVRWEEQHLDGPVDGDSPSDPPLVTDGGAPGGDQRPARER